ncbi:hypothetical protein DPEC_G00167180 [Dallia pectoralis]|uniref:Uncharacterized protein n=1 Tax=Dallia pectoralis TaxID=75939 RepID=A0ACC2GHI9_DALPE|nr:hypothetical protein DPEC_G00167180 [Dallia pectoralis]
MERGQTRERRYTGSVMQQAVLSPYRDHLLHLPVLCLPRKPGDTSLMSAPSPTATAEWSENVSQGEVIPSVIPVVTLQPVPVQPGCQ